MEWWAEEEVGVSCPSCWAVLGRSVSCNLKWLKSCTLCYLFDLDTISLISFTEGLSHIPDCGLGSLIQSLGRQMPFASGSFTDRASPAVTFRLLTTVRNPVHSVTHTHTHTHTHTSVQTNKKIQENYPLLLCVMHAVIFCPVLFWVLFCFFFN